MLEALDDILVKSLCKPYTSDHATKLYENISVYDLQFRHLVHKVVNNEEAVEPIARNFTKCQLPKFININCTDEEFKNTYGWPDDKYIRLRKLIQRIETLKEVLISHYHETWEAVTGATTVQQTQVTKSLKQMTDELMYKLKTRLFQPYNLSDLFKFVPRSVESRPSVFYYGHVDYDNSL